MKQGVGQAAVAVEVQCEEEMRVKQSKKAARGADCGAERGAGCLAEGKTEQEAGGGSGSVIERKAEAEPARSASLSGKWWFPQRGFEGAFLKLLLFEQIFSYKYFQYIFAGSFVSASLRSP